MVVPNDERVAMRRKNSVELAKTRILKLARSLVRLKHSLAADEELNQVLPELERRFDRAVVDGKPYQLATESALELLKVNK